MNGDLDGAIKLYEENARLSEAFYTPLQNLEIAFRNAIAVHLSARYGNDWHVNGAPNFNVNSREMIAAAMQGLPANAPVGSVIAELKFAFWVGLLGPGYDATLWRQGLYKAFLAGGGKPRKTIQGRFNALRRFRNRVMHHEPVFDRPLQQLHDEIIEAISWICRDTAAWTAHHSRFQVVLTTT